LLATARGIRRVIPITGQGRPRPPPDLSIRPRSQTIRSRREYVLTACDIRIRSKGVRGGRAIAGDFLKALGILFASQEDAVFPGGPHHNRHRKNIWSRHLVQILPNHLDGCQRTGLGTPCNLGRGRRGILADRWRDLHLVVDSLRHKRPRQSCPLREDLHSADLFLRILAHYVVLNCGVDDNIREDGLFGRAGS
jgi:hypothetical protein